MYLGNEIKKQEYNYNKHQLKLEIRENFYSKFDTAMQIQARDCMLPNILKLHSITEV